MKTTDLWSGSFGDEYLARNRVLWQARVPFWESAIQFTEAKSVFEFGCNAGWNLRAIQAVSQDIELHGVDINASAVEEARQAGFEVQRVHEQGIVGLYEPGSMDLTFTAGVLIHVAPADLERTMRSLIELSGRYVMAIEYHSDDEQEVEYRGHSGALWKRDYGKLYQDLGLTLLAVVPNAEGFDDCTAYLLSKGAAE